MQGDAPWWTLWWHALVNLTAFAAKSPQSCAPTTPPTGSPQALSWRANLPDQAGYASLGAAHMGTPGSCDSMA